MHRTIRRLLPDAEGASEWVVAVNADIRGFTSAMSANPSETALYLKKLYARILDRFFADHSFFKPTGDGLLLVIPFTETELDTVAASVITDSLALVDEFPNLIADEPLVTFPHPDRAGIGISVGSVARLVTRRTTLDYTGRPLNVASRLMDLARPAGVVVDASLPIPKPLLRRFAPDLVYLKGVAERAPLKILFTESITEIPDTYRKPIRPDVWFEESETVTVAACHQRSGWFRHHLAKEPTNRQRIELTVIYPDYKGRKPVPGIVRHWKLRPPDHFGYYLEGDSRPIVKVDYDKLIERFKSLKIPRRTEITLAFGYPTASPSSSGEQAAG